MYLKSGVTAEHLEALVREALELLDAAYPGLVVTSTTEGKHKEGSLHYCGRAADLRKRTWDGKDTLAASRLRGLLGEGWDVVEETDHFHIEYDPKEKP